MLKHPPIDESLHALAEPTRRAIVERLSQGPASVSDLAAPFDVTLAAIVQHLQVLEACGLVKSEKVGRVRTCRLEPKGFDHIVDWIDAHRTRIENKLDHLGALLNETEQQSKPRKDDK